MDAPEDVPFREITNAIDRRFVADPQFGGGLSIMGYSQGGGATHDLIERLWDERDIITTFGVFLDAVDHDGAFSENDWPDVAFVLLNIYQEISFLGGGDIDDDEVIPGAFLDEINVTVDAGWDHSLIHRNIDDNIAVQQAIRGTLEDVIPER